ncbi:MAG: sugar phosphate isomerase/epimerase [Fimbriimonadales bacterium]|nr:sugar phosphate isomerase/epimerase [Fimbriimonadales bacterium]
MSELKIGLIGIVGDERREDLWGTLETLVRFGYRGIECPNYLLEGDATENLRRFRALGLEPLNVGCVLGDLRERFEGLVAEAKALGVDRVSMWWSSCETRQEVADDAAAMNEFGRRLRDEGLTLCYHNHHHEFLRSYQGARAFDLLCDLLDPECVQFEIDCGWVAFAGEDPAEVLRRLAGRVPAIHVKDFVAARTDPPEFTAVGTGILDVPGTLRAAIDTGVRWAVVEQDRLRNLNGLETAIASILNLRETGLV